MTGTKHEYSAMPIVNLTRNNPFEDGRQSLRALAVRSGMERYFTDRAWVFLPELTLSSGRRADIMALSPQGEVIIVEIKSSLADLRADTKWHEYREDCDRLWFATLGDVPADAFPQDTGFLVADEYGAELHRDCEPHKLNAARRKALHLRFARASATRLARCCAHAGLSSSDFSNGD